MLFCIALHQVNAGRGFSKLPSSGQLSFRGNGQLYKAVSTHARGYAVPLSDTAFIRAANNTDLVINLEWYGFTGTGSYQLRPGSGTAAFILQHKDFNLEGQGCYLRIIINKITQQGAFRLLSGRFEGELQHVKGERMKITEGTFETYSL